MLDKTEKILATGFFITLPLCFIFTEKSNYGTNMPKFELLYIPFVFLLIGVIYNIWKK